MRKYGYVPNVRSRGEEKMELAAGKRRIGGLWGGALMVQQVQEDYCPIREEVFIRGTASVGGCHNCFQKTKYYFRISS